MSNPKTYAELVKLISAILPNASFDEDLEGQIVIYTDLSETKDERGQTVLTQFVSE